jgi:CII-binding regulator of phage lambda lysogenization HflD
MNFKKILLSLFLLSLFFNISHDYVIQNIEKHDVQVLVLEEKQSNQKDQVSDLINRIHQALHMPYIQIENSCNYHYEITSKFSTDLKSDLFKYQLISEIFKPPILI